MGCRFSQLDFFCHGFFFNTIFIYFLPRYDFATSSLPLRLNNLRGVACNIAFLHYFGRMLYTHSAVTSNKFYLHCTSPRITGDCHAQDFDFNKFTSSINGHDVKATNEGHSLLSQPRRNLPHGINAKTAIAQLSCTFRRCILEPPESKRSGDTAK
jgi:hypothetical protein